MTRLLDQLLGNVDRERFFEAHWQRCHCVARIAPALLNEALTLPELVDPARLVASHDEITAWGKRRIPGWREVRGDGALEALEHGFSLYLTHVERSVPALQEALNQLEAELGIGAGRAECEAFVSRAGAGVPMHFDFDDNFNVSLRGEKRWRVATNRSVKNPHNSYFVGGVTTEAMERYRTGPFPERMPDDAATFDTTAGDVVFLPSGTWHETTALSDTFAISFVLKPQRWNLLLLEDLAPRLLQREELRQLSYGRLGGGTHPFDVKGELEAALGALKEIVGELTPQDVLASRSGSVTRPPRFRRVLDVALSRHRDGDHRWGILAGDDLEIEIAAPLCGFVEWVAQQSADFSAAQYKSGSLSQASLTEALNELCAHGVVEGVPHIA